MDPTSPIPHIKPRRLPHVKYREPTERRVGVLVLHSYMPHLVMEEGVGLVDFDATLGNGVVARNGVVRETSHQP